ncbi:catalase [Streptomyces sp. DK15]|uniref:catalase n=1 Tax=Streptomyces sp. DK15 TaxID=2957499 RepID=UPI0029B310DA|nr:catalase [Streptomyces sp. DK15]MDX2394071.1 catalase [Streptomyces sp. DK15]
MNSDTQARGAHLVEQLAAATGADPGRRLLHARGAWAEGEFAPSPLAASLSTAAVFTAPRTPVTARFSTTLGGAGGHDGDPGDQGLALRVGDLDLVTFTLPVFFVRTGADLIDFFRAIRSDDPAAFAAFLRGHPEAATALGFAGKARPATSFTGVTYHAVHSFGLVDAAGTNRWVRLSLRPLRPLPSLDPEQALALPADYLARDLTDRLPAGFELTAHLPDPADELHDPTRLWTGTETVALGTLTLTRPQEPATETAFDPLRLPRGITAPQDQLSEDRSTAYAQARRRRAS